MPPSCGEFMFIEVCWTTDKVVKEIGRSFDTFQIIHSISLSYKNNMTGKYP